MQTIKSEIRFSLADVLMVSDVFFSNGLLQISNHSKEVLQVKLKDKNLSAGWIRNKHPNLYVFFSAFYEMPKDGYYILPFTNNVGTGHFVASFDKPKLKTEVCDD